ncbi:putative pre-mRNA-splicing factor 38A [Apostichopus japonicus]|uniref:Pre-mRNA-splicing factor 38 n=1 Tax=Stichopus japonicus TaxID=307972 RepID=A0A2G8JW38_STIJA|nr:putative pre-mRNA-splicing factor 38A [Apostichopus japonicus]
MLCNTFHTFTAELLVDKAMELRYIGGTFGGNIKPTPFLCLILKMLQIQPEKDIIIEFIKNEDFKYVRLLGAFYMRIVGESLDVYKYLEPLYLDYRKIRTQNKQGEFVLSHVDEFIDELLREERVCDVILPRIQKRKVLEDNEQLETRVNALEEDMDEVEESSDEEMELEELQRHKSPERRRNHERRRRSASPRHRRSKSRSPHRKRRSPSPREKEEEVDHPSAAGVLIVRGGESPDHQIIGTEMSEIVTIIVEDTGLPHQTTDTENLIVTDHKADNNVSARRSVTNAFRRRRKSRIDSFSRAGT